MLLLLLFKLVLLICTAVMVICFTQEHLTREGMSWIDDQNGEERLYWFPGLFPDISIYNE